MFFVMERWTHTKMIETMDVSVEQISGMNIDRGKGEGEY
jgi:hypothetical protein